MFKPTYFGKFREYPFLHSLNVLTAGVKKSLYKQDPKFQTADDVHALNTQMWGDAKRNITSLSTIHFFITNTLLERNKAGIRLNRTPIFAHPTFNDYVYRIQASREKNNLEKNPLSPKDLIRFLQFGSTENNKFMELYEGILTNIDHYTNKFLYTTFTNEQRSYYNFVINTIYIPMLRGDFSPFFLINGVREDILEQVIAKNVEWLRKFFPSEDHDFIPTPKHFAFPSFFDEEEFDEIAFLEEFAAQDMGLEIPQNDEVDSKIKLDITYLQRESNSREYHTSEEESFQLMAILHCLNKWVWESVDSGTHEGLLKLIGTGEKTYKPYYEYVAERKGRAGLFSDNPIDYRNKPFEKVKDADGRELPEYINTALEQGHYDLRNVFEVDYYYLPSHYEKEKYKGAHEQGELESISRIFKHKTQDLVSVPSEYMRLSKNTSKDYTLAGVKPVEGTIIPSWNEDLTGQLPAEHKKDWEHYIELWRKGASIAASYNIFVNDISNSEHYAHGAKVQTKNINKPLELADILVPQPVNLFPENPADDLLRFINVETEHNDAPLFAALFDPAAMFANDGTPTAGLSNYYDVLLAHRASEVFRLCNVEKENYYVHTPALPFVSHLFDLHTRAENQDEYTCAAQLRLDYKEQIQKDMIGGWVLGSPYVPNTNYVYADIKIKLVQFLTNMVNEKESPLVKFPLYDVCHYGSDLTLYISPEQPLTNYGLQDYWDGTHKSRKFLIDAGNLAVSQIQTNTPTEDFEKYIKESENRRIAQTLYNELHWYPNLFEKPFDNSVIHHYKDSKHEFTIPMPYLPLCVCKDEKEQKELMYTHQYGVHINEQTGDSAKRVRNAFIDYDLGLADKYNRKEYKKDMERARQHHPIAVIIAQYQINQMPSDKLYAALISRTGDIKAPPIQVIDAEPLANMIYQRIAIHNSNES